MVHNHSLGNLSRLSKHKVLDALSRRQGVLEERGVSADKEQRQQTQINRANPISQSLSTLSFAQLAITMQHQSILTLSSLVDGTRKS